MSPDWEQSAVAWLLDQCPPDYRAHPVLRRQPVALAWFAWRHVAASQDALVKAAAAARTELGSHVSETAMVEVLTVIDHEQARLLAAARGVDLIARALQGRQYVPKL